MPRNVRPSWVEISLDNSSNSPAVVKATGPKGRSGTLSALFKVREDGVPVDLFAVDMIGSADGAHVMVTIVDKRTGKPLFSQRFDQ